jgi:hypothetical protein
MMQSSEPGVPSEETSRVPNESIQHARAPERVKRSDWERLAGPRRRLDFVVQTPDDRRQWFHEIRAIQYIALEQALRQSSEMLRLGPIRQCAEKKMTMALWRRAGRVDLGSAVGYLA